MKKAIITTFIIALFTTAGFAQNSGREQFPPPQNLNYFCLEPDYIEFNWSMPTIENWIHWDDGNIVVSIDFGPGVTGMIASRWDQNSLEPYIGRYLKSIRFVPEDEHVDYTLKVWRGENASNEVLSQTTSGLNYGTWNEIELSDSIYIDGTQELWFGFEFSYDTSGISSVTLDDGSNTVDGYGNMLFMNGSWQTMLSTGMAGNWNLIGILNSGTKTGKSLSTADSRNVNTLVGYNLYRDNVKISGPFPETYEYDSPDNPGIYEYYVTAQYDNGESDPSNKVVVYWLTTSIDENNSLGMKLFPNPATTVLNIQSTQPVKQLVITNSSGKIVYFETISGRQNNISVDVSNLAHETYIVTVTCEGKTISEQFVVK